MSERLVDLADGARLQARSDGEPAAPALLLSNSLGTDLTSWDTHVKRWTDHHWVVRYDQRGHGRSDATDGPYTIEQLGRDALAVLDAHGIGRADVCGISLGGQVALWLGAHAPDRVRRLVLADTGARVGTEQAWRERAATVRDGGMEAVVDLVLERFFSDRFRQQADPALARVEATLRTTPPEGYAAACEALATADLRDDARKVDARCLVLVGTADVATPPEDAQTLTDLLPRADLVELPDVGHLANLEAPEDFTQIVRDFLTSSDREHADA